jgi:hypothetical protein
MLKIWSTKLIPLLILAALLVFSGCSATPHTQVKAADPVMNTILTTSGTLTTTATTSVFTTPDIPPFDQSNWKITQDQAIAIASACIPADIANRAEKSANMEAAGNLKTGETNYYWDIDFVNISVTQAELGWQSDSRTTLIPGIDGTFDQIVIRIDAVSGEIVSKTADTAIYLGPFIPAPASFYPANGATNVPLNNITFTWPALEGTNVTYQFALAQASANTSADEFAIVDYSDTSFTNAEPSQETLQYHTVYWWEVRAVFKDLSGNVTSYGPWSAQMFTTTAGPTTGLQLHTTEVTPTTSFKNSGSVIPAYLFWAVTAVCIILIAFIIVMVVRNRRSP